MRKIVFSLSVSLDGFFEGPDHDISWSRVDDELHQFLNDTFRPMSAYLNGRVTHELMAEFWPTADEDHDGPTGEYAGIWRDKQKYVWSRDGEVSTDWNVTVRRSVSREEVLALKDQPGADMLVGGPDLAAEFFRLGLVDEVWMLVHPVAIGTGRSAFEVPVDLRLVGTREFGNGVVELRYEVVA
ncbi:dihydrofolate reductase family protein [Cellulomonas sp. McL0617]|uniref:dihydrofolate reductase family protein n=1 Tax=Cellulomonas sp. McL0617 TaxID=3415675 RepID=UPI003CFA6495